MRRDFRFLTAAAGLLIAISASDTACAQTRGGLLRVAHRDSPASMSSLEEVTISTVAPMMAVFNNLVIFDQHVPQNTLRSIVPDLATAWLWNEDGTELTFPLHRGVRWEIERTLAEDDARPIVYYNRGAACWRPEVKGLTLMVNGNYNGWRLEDAWLDK